MVPSMISDVLIDSKMYVHGDFINLNLLVQSSKGPIFQRCSYIEGRIVYMRVCKGLLRKQSNRLSRWLIKKTMHGLQVTDIYIATLIFNQWHIRKLMF